MPSPGSQGGASPVDDDSPTPELLPVSGPLVLVVSGTTPEVLPALVPVAVGSLVPVADGSTVVLVGPALVPAVLDSPEVDSVSVPDTGPQHASVSAQVIPR